MRLAPPLPDLVRVAGGVAAGVLIFAGLWWLGALVAARLALPLPGAILGILLYLGLASLVPALGRLARRGGMLLLSLLGLFLLPLCVEAWALMAALGPATLARVLLLLLLSTLASGLVAALVLRLLASRGPKRP